MSDNKTPDQTPLWGESPNYGEGPTETAVREAIEAMNADETIVGYRKAIAQVCRALGKNIDAGNTKGRAVANEAMQLATLLEKLAGVEPDEIDPSAMPPETKALMDALATPPRLDTPTASYPAEL